ncbi:hypothetical protein E5676_scaffold73G00940 [Cucumis melo var. makuwa]|uniref:Uncharacterized protein n=1 Tax=Cucumis melo var. makuwa TaxID=1194695 RepID=A0A5D3CGJ5_CUCMM|nr:hypothetical protein E5676_scaffold73G00940 [Cucumis melo var. makuwa]
MGPSLDVRCYNGCIIDGVRIHTSKRDPQRTTKNSRVMVIGKSNANKSGDNNFYGVLDEVLHAQYLMEEVFGYLSTNGIMSSFSSDFEETNVIFLELRKDLNTTGGSSLVGDNLGESLGAPFKTLDGMYGRLALSLRSLYEPCILGAITDEQGC